MKKIPGDIILLYIHVYHKWRSYNIWFLKYKMQQTEIFDILGHFLPFQPLDNLENQNFNIEKNTWRYYHFTHLHHLHPEIWSTIGNFCHSGPFFLPFYPIMDPENLNFQKNEKNTWTYYHFTNINDSHMMYGSPDMECNGQNFLSFWTIFCTFTLLTTKKIKILKNRKNCLEILRCNKNDNHVMYVSWDIPSLTDRIFCHFGPFFAFLLPSQP